MMQSLDPLWRGAKAASAVGHTHRVAGCDLLSMPMDYNPSGPVVKSKFR